MVSEFEAEKKNQGLLLRFMGREKKREKLFLAANVRPTGNESDPALVREDNWFRRKCD